MKNLLHRGKNLTNAQKYENAIMLLHTPHVKSEKEKRRDRVSAEYAEWSEANEGHTREEGKAKFQEIYNRICG